MTITARPGALLLAAALAIGIAADILLRAVPPGIGWSGWILLFTAAPPALGALLGKPTGRDSLVAAFCSALCALGITLRDSGPLVFLNVCGALTACGLLAARTASRGLRRTSVYELIHAMLVHLVHSIAGAGFLLAHEIAPVRAPASPRRKAVVSVVRGCALAVPALFVFGTLFASADDAFHTIAAKFFDVDLSTLVSHAALTCAVGWVSAGFLRGALLADEVPAPVTLRESFFSLGIVEVGMLLGLLDALFLLFVALQVPYLFGGAATVAGTPSLTVAAYFRKGFFELTAVACLTILTLLIADWILRKEKPRDALIFRSLAGLTLMLLGLIMASAWQRFFLYLGAYGLTELRVYAAASLAIMGLVAAWFAWSVLTGRRELFAGGAIAAAYAVLIALTALNPDALIARVNLSRIAAGKSCDAAYIAHLSADASDELMGGLPRLPSADASAVARNLLRFGDRVADPLSWNVARSRAFAAVQRHREMLAQFVVMPLSTHHTQE